MSDTGSEAKFRIFCFGNCQAQAIGKLLPLVLPADGFQIDYRANNPRTGDVDSVEGIHRLAAEADLIYFYPLEERHGELAATVIAEKCKPECIRIRHPYVFNSGFFSMARAPFGAGAPYGEIFGQDYLIAHLAKHGLQKTIDAYLRSRIDFHVVERSERCLAEMKRREGLKLYDVTIAGFLEDQCRKRRLYLSHNHVTTAVHLEFLRQIQEISGLPMDLSKINLSVENLAQMAHVDAPFTPHDQRSHRTEFGPDPKWREIGLRLISLIAEQHPRFRQESSVSAQGRIRGRRNVYRADVGSAWKQPAPKKSPANPAILRMRGKAA